MPFRDSSAGVAKMPVLILLGAVGMVLLIACSNIAGLMLARTSTRARELAVRAALGATRARLMRAGLAETVLLTGGGRRGRGRDGAGDGGPAASVGSRERRGWIGCGGWTSTSWRLRSWRLWLRGFCSDLCRHGNYPRWIRTTHCRAADERWLAEHASACVRAWSWWRRHWHSCCSWGPGCSCGAWRGWKKSVQASSRMG